MLEREIEARSATVGVIGLGYAGLPLAAAFARAGYRTLGFDTDPAKVAALAEGGFRGPLRSVRSADSYVPIGPAADRVLLDEDEVLRAALELLP